MEISFLLKPFFIFEKETIFAQNSNIMWKSFILSLILYLCSNVLLVAQEFINPVFDRGDVVPSFRVEKVNITQDTTFVYCSFKAEADSWANISKDMYLEDVKSGEHFPLLKVWGLPYSPATRDFTKAEIIQVILYFPHINIPRFNIIEYNNKEGINIYGIDLSDSYSSKYEESDYKRFRNMSDFYLSSNNELKLLEYEEKELQATQYLYGKKSSLASLCYRQLSETYNHLGDYSKAIDFRLQKLKCDSALYGTENKEHPDYPYTLECLALIYENAGKDSEALQCLQKCIEIWRKIGSADNYLNEICNLLRTGRDSAGIVKRIEIAQRELSSPPCYINVSSIPIATIQSLIAVGYSCIDDNVNSLKYCDKALMILKDAGYETSPEYAEVLSVKCRCQRRSGAQSHESIIIGEKAKHLFETLNIKSRTYADLLNDLACDYGLNYDYEKAITLQKEAAELYEVTEDWIALAEAYNSISDYYQGANDIKNASLYIKKAIDMIDKHDDAKQYTDNPISFSIVQKRIDCDKTAFRGTLAKIYQKEGKISDAIITETERGIILKNMGNEQEYANHLLDLSDYYLKDNQLEKAESCAERSAQLFKNDISMQILSISQLAIIFCNKENYEKAIQYVNKSLSLLEPDDFWGRVTILSIASVVYWKAHKYTMSETILSELLDILQSLITNEVSGMTNEQRQRLWNKYEHNFLLYRNVIKEIDHNEVFLSKLYDYVLFSKSFLLDTGIKKNDSSLSQHGITWKDIQGVLSEDDLAVEFIATTHEDHGGFTYSALVVDNNCQSPQLIELYNDFDIAENLDTLGKRIWDSILNKTPKAKNIYFSPDFYLHVIPIEYLKSYDNELVFEKYNIYRLSSTKELLKRKNENIQGQAVLYGGLEYNQMSDFALEEITGTLPSLLRGISERGGFEPLYNTLDEVNDIKDLLSNQNIATKLHVGNEGTEESFRKLSNMDVHILHLATHGMYIEPENVSYERQTKNLDFLESLNNENNPVKEDVTLTHSFLVLSGGNKLIQHDKVLNDDDGILTAKEISQTNLKGVDLVVLSACESALGDINSNGVCGLQRGFKKAGVNTILMSVNKVDDVATKILMVEFYRNLISGKSKLQSLKDAQKYLRECENGKYDNPKYWASFIMLDGLD